MRTVSETGPQRLQTLRKQQRRQEVEKRRNSMRFDNEVMQLNAEQEIPNPSVTQEALILALQQQDVAYLYAAVFHRNFQVLRLMQVHTGRVVDLLCAKLALPKAILTLGNLALELPCYAQAVFSQHRFEQVVGYARKMSVGSKEQRVYVWTICALAERAEHVDYKQLQPLYRLLEELLHGDLTEGREDNLTVRLVKIVIECSSERKGLGVDMLLEICGFFWKVEKSANIVNLFMAVATLVQANLFCRSTLVLLHLLRVLLEGRKRLPQTLDTECIPSALSLLLACLRNYNSVWADMQAECSFQLKGQTIKTGLHGYLLHFESHIFANVPLQQPHYQFLLQFCRNGPVEQIATVWSNLGLLQQLINQLSTSPSLCYIALQILYRLAVGDDQVGWRYGSNHAALELLKMHMLEQQLVMVVMPTFHDSAITRLAQQLLSILQASDCR